MVLGNCYEKGIGVDKDEKMAIEWYLKAANQQKSSLPIK
jgi:TPR repeat protein